MELSRGLKNCLLLAMEDPDLDFEETVDTGLRLYAESIGGVIEIEDEEEGMEMVGECFRFVIDAVLGNLEDMGVIEMKGVDPEEGVVWGLSEGVEGLLGPRP